MKINRRQFLGVTGTAAGTVLAGVPGRTRAAGPPISPDTVGCLIDTTLCVGCRKCEQACNERHNLPAPDKSFEDLSVFETKRRPDYKSYMVVNRYQLQGTGSIDTSATWTYVTLQCMHCLDPACISVCPVGALSKQKSKDPAEVGVFALRIYSTVDGYGRNLTTTSPCCSASSCPEYH